MQSSNEKEMYRLNDDICFRRCSLSTNEVCMDYGDCTNYLSKDVGMNKHYSCRQYGIHLHCAVHPQMELSMQKDDIFGNVYLKCIKCQKTICIDNFDETIKDCLRMLNADKFKNIKLIRLDDWYVPEIKEKIEDDRISDYWIKADVKTDKDNDTVVVLYIGNRNSKDKAQFFIKPEKLQLTSDHKDMDPATIISKIEVTLKDRKLTQKYD